MGWSVSNTFFQNIILFAVAFSSRRLASVQINCGSSFERSLSLIVCLDWVKLQVSKAIVNLNYPIRSRFAKAILPRPAQVVSWLDTLLASREQCQLVIAEGRHPMAEALMTNGNFVPNSIELSENLVRCMCITGPNMGGKSCYSRMVSRNWSIERCIIFLFSKLRG